MEKNRHNKKNSRKWFLVQLVFWVTTLAFFVPPLISAWVFKAKVPLIIIDGVQYVSMISIIITSYFGANVLQRNVELRQGLDYGNFIGNVSVETTPEMRNITDDENDEGKEA